MNPRTGIAMMAVGGLIALAGLIWLVTGDFDNVPESAVLTAAPTATTIATTSTTTTAAPTTTSTTTTTTTTTTSTTTTTTTTTTTEPPVETVEDFLVLFRDALDNDDIDFLYDRLHPIVIDSFGADLCRAYVEREIAILDNYQATGPASSPETQTIQGESVDVITVPVEFDFQGEHFEANSSYALVDGEVRYFTECR